MLFKFVGAKWKLSMKFDHQISWFSCTSILLLHIRLSLLTDSLCPALVVCSVINILTLLWEPWSCSTRTKTTNGLGKESTNQDNGTHTGENVTSGMMIFLQGTPCKSHIVKEKENHLTKQPNPPNTAVNRGKDSASCHEAHTGENVSSMGLISLQSRHLKKMKTID